MKRAVFLIPALAFVVVCVSVAIIWSLFVNRVLAVKKDVDREAAKRCEVALGAAHTGRDTLYVMHNFYRCPPP